jgi:hypothetical protein
MNADAGGELADGIDQCQFSGSGQPVFQFGVAIEMILDRAFVALGDEQHVIDAGGGGLLDDVLDCWPIQHGQKLFRHRFGGRQHTRAPAGGGDDGFEDVWH